MGSPLKGSRGEVRDSDLLGVCAVKVIFGEIGPEESFELAANALASAIAFENMASSESLQLVSFLPILT